MTIALKSIHIEGFKKFRKFDMEFNPKVNILVGENEAGKTTILEAIKLVLNQTYRFADKSSRRTAEPARSFRNYGITGNVVTRKAAKNIVASSSYHTPSKIVLPVQRTVPSVATGKRILWWASKERHASSHWWTGRVGTCLVKRHDQDCH